VGRIARRPDATGLKIEIVGEREVCRVALRGELTFRTAASVVKTLTKLLLNYDAVMVDLSRLTVGWAPALQAFPTALTSAGGWPFARLALFGATTEVSAALHGVRVPTTVPLAQNARAARGLLKTRPNQVMRCHELANDVSSPRRARALVRQTCADWDLAAVAGEAALVANELVTNAVQHARTSSRLRIAVDERGLHLAVQDFRPGRLPPPRPLGGSCGAGLRVVAGLTRRWGVTPCTDGKWVWAVLGIDTR
jgi:anti-sigma regulatory factor (Ser/Thr protein kinase)